jgi:hypothetical protein
VISKNIFSLLCLGCLGIQSVGFAMQSYYNPAYYPTYYNQTTIPAAPQGLFTPAYQYFTETLYTYDIQAPILQPNTALPQAQTPRPAPSYNHQDLELVAAAKQGDYKKVRSLLSQGVSPDAQDGKQTTALQWAAGNGRWIIVIYLLLAGADVHRQHPVTGKTALQWAAGKGSLECVNLLLSRGANPLTPDRQGKTPLWWAQQQGHQNIVAVLSEAIKVASRCR